jgi:hypothetical protein
MRLAPYLNALLMVSQMLRSAAPVSAVISLKIFMCASVTGPAVERMGDRALQVGLEHDRLSAGRRHRNQQHQQQTAKYAPTHASPKSRVT